MYNILYLKQLICVCVELQDSEQFVQLLLNRISVCAVMLLNRILLLHSHTVDSKIMIRIH